MVPGSVLLLGSLAAMLGMQRLACSVAFVGYILEGGRVGEVCGVSMPCLGWAARAVQCELDIVSLCEGFGKVR